MIQRDLLFVSTVRMGNPDRDENGNPRVLPSRPNFTFRKVPEKYILFFTVP